MIIRADGMVWGAGTRVWKEEGSRVIDVFSLVPTGGLKKQEEIGQERNATYGPL